MDGDETLIDHGSDYLMFLPLLFAQNSPPLEKLLTQFLQDDNEYEFKQQDSCSQDEVSAPKRHVSAALETKSHKQLRPFSPAEGRLTVCLMYYRSIQSHSEASIFLTNTHSCFEGFSGNLKDLFYYIKV